jgi:hypothetical protein
MCAGDTSVTTVLIVKKERTKMTQHRTWTAYTWLRAPWASRKRAIRAQARDMGHTLGQFSKRRSSCSAMTWSMGDITPYGASSGVCDSPCVVAGEV